ncbi:hypothetical protein Goklo_027869, partial [Gossypium klotzschianum]|nr:hypothetical protein [Gossypium klotzschianum]
MRVVVTPSVWIREEPMERNIVNVSSNGRKEQNEVGTNALYSGNEEKDDMEDDNEEISIKNNEGKKLHGSNIQASPSYTYKGIKGQANGTWGGLSLGWRSELSRTLKSFSNNHIDVSIEKKEVGAIWRLTGFYGAYKEDGLPRDQGRMEEFQSILSECQLKYVGYVGRWFTWERGLKELVKEGNDSDLRLGGPWRRVEQQARMNWLKEGDKNTKFFHSFASQRRRVNHIDELEDEFGLITSDSYEMVDVAKRYFENLFTLGGICNTDYILLGIENRILKDIKKGLTDEFTRDEIVFVIKNMRPNKAPGYDGFSALFFQKYCHIVGTNKVLDACIDKDQSVFVPGELITDNVLLAYELMHTFKQRRLGQHGSLALKLDTSKAYDREGWLFLEKFLQKLGTIFANERFDKGGKSVLKSLNVLDYKGDQVTAILEVQTSHNLERYLGLPNMIGREPYPLIPDEVYGLRKVCLKKDCVGRLGMRNKLEYGMKHRFWELRNTKFNTKEELIKNTFHADDAKRILCIPFPMEKEADRMVWRGVASRLYSKEGLSPLRDPFVKINFDAAFDKQHMRSCSGILICDQRGKAIRFGAGFGFLKVELEGDALTIIKKLQNQEEDRSVLRAYITDRNGLRRQGEIQGFSLLPMKPEERLENL